VATDHYVDIPVVGSSPYWQDAVADFASLPTTGAYVGEIRLTLDTMNAYEWNGSAWVLAWAAGSIVGPASSVDGQILLFNGTTGKLAKAAASSGFVKTASGVYAVQASISLTADISGILPVANGGTNSGTTLNNNRVIKSSGGALIEAAAITAARTLISDANGIPTHSAVTATELGYVSGVTSAIQTQLDGKEPTITSGTATQYWRGDKSFQTLDMTALLATTAGTAQATGKIGEVLTASQTSNTTTGVAATGTYGSPISLSLTAGSWLISGTAGFNENGATLTTGVQTGISASSTGSGINEFDTQLAPYLISSTSDALLTTPVVYVDISSTTTYYLNTRFWYTSGTPQHRGRIQARRVR
jgi:phosphohistidine swiveling domain-containing protein